VGSAAASGTPAEALPDDVKEASLEDDSSLEADATPSTAGLAQGADGTPIWASPHRCCGLPGALARGRLDAFDGDALGEPADCQSSKRRNRSGNLFGGSEF